VKINDYPWEIQSSSGFPFNVLARVRILAVESERRKALENRLKGFFLA
jgi:hypothetical protein